MKRLNQRGAGLGEYLFWALLIAVLAWAVHSFLSRPENMNSVDTHDMMGR